MTNKLSEFKLFSGSEILLDEDSIGNFKYAGGIIFKTMMKDIVKYFKV